jgi:hypothetical protein
VGIAHQALLVARGNRGDAGVARRVGRGGPVAPGRQSIRRAPCGAGFPLLGLHETTSAPVSRSRLPPSRKPRSYEPARNVLIISNHTLARRRGVKPGGVRPSPSAVPRIVPGGVGPRGPPGPSPDGCQIIRPGANGRRTGDVEQGKKLPPRHLGVATCSPTDRPSPPAGSARCRSPHTAAPGTAPRAPRGSTARPPRVLRPSAGRKKTGRTG